MEMEKSQIRIQCEELKTEIEQLKSVSQQKGPDVSTSSAVEESVKYADGERYCRTGLWWRRSAG